MKQLRLALPLIGNGEECPNPKQGHQEVHLAVTRRARGSGRLSQCPYANSNASRVLDTNGGVRSKGERFSQADGFNARFNSGSCPQAAIQPQVQYRDSGPVPVVVCVPYWLALLAVNRG